MIKKALVALTACTSIAGCVSQPLPQRASNPELAPRVIAEPDGLFFAGLDRDGDGATSRDEAAGQLPVLFGHADRDESGTLKPIEIQDFILAYFGSEDIALGTNMLDVGGNGTVTTEEFTKFFLERFDGRDKDRDGILTREEFVRTVDPTDANRGQQRYFASPSQRPRRP